MDQIDQSDYNKALHSEIDWYILADDYYYSAHVLVENSKRRFPWVTDDRVVVYEAQPFYLLMGICIETLIKGIYFDQDKEVYAKMPKSVLNHDLVDLSGRIDKLDVPIFYSSEEILFLELLSAGMYWLNKYPVPRNEEKFNSFIRKNKKQECWKEKDEHYVLFKNIYSKLRDFSGRIDAPDCRDGQIDG